MKASTMDGPAVTKGARSEGTYVSDAPVLALLAVVVEGLGAGVKWY